MGKASSAKKIKKVQQAGVSRAPGQRRNLGFPALIIGIIVVGTILTGFARNHSREASAAAPVVNRDHWHAAFGVNLCGQFQPPLGDDGPDTQGIHTHNDGLIHIHPFVGAAAGDNATFSVYARQVGLTLDDGSFTMPDGTTYANGDDCEGEDGEAVEGRVALYVWPPQSTEATDPEIVTTDLGSVRFQRDGQIFVLAFAPEDAEIGFPPSMEELASPNDLEPSDPGSVDFTVPPADDDAPGTDSEDPGTEATPSTETSTTEAGG